MREHRWRRGRARGRKGTRRGEETNEEEAHRRRSSSLENQPPPPRGTLQVFTPPFSSRAAEGSTGVGCDGGEGQVP